MILEDKLVRHSLTHRWIFAALIVVLAVIHVGCAYRMPGVVHTSPEVVQIVATSPKQYVLSVDTESTIIYNVPANGRVTIPIPNYRPSCGVYLFDKVKISGDKDLLKEWNVSIMHNGKIARKISLRKVKNLPTDQQGYHILKIND